MKTAEITPNEAYVLNDGSLFIPVERCNWKTGAWNGAAQRTWYNGEYGEQWAPQHAIHSSRIVQSKAAADEAARRHAERQAQRDAELRAEFDALTAEHADLIAAMNRYFGVEDGTTVRPSWDRDGSVTITGPYVDLAAVALAYADLARELGRLPKNLLRSTGSAAVLTAKLAGLPVEDTGHRDTIMVEGADEVAAWSRVVAS